MSASINSMSPDLNIAPLEDIKKKLGLPEDAIFCGYLVHIKQKDQFLSTVMETASVSQRNFVRTPELAQRFNEYGEAYNIARPENNEKIVGLFDSGTQLYVYPIV